MITGQNTRSRGRNAYTKKRVHEVTVNKSVVDQKSFTSKGKCAFVNAHVCVIEPETDVGHVICSLKAWSVAHVSGLNVRF